MFMAEADAVSSPLYKFFVHLHLFCSHLLLLKMTQSQTDGSVHVHIFLKRHRLHVQF